ncbi:MAG: ESX secretion-associated protein EspG [Actinophytocola sp.]|uniref:ESX secretion-associated protein EspG n=1 Tax=Actinophytocola sp. TaxID=1872138 RepID=UPI003C73EE1D
MDVLVETSRLPPLPYPLEIPVTGDTVGARRRHVASMAAVLAERGLMEDGEVVPGLRNALQLLASGELVLDGRLGGPRPADIVAVVRRDRAVVAVQTGDSVRLDRVPDHAVVGMVVDLLPATRQLQGGSTAIRQDTLDAALSSAVDSGDIGELTRVLRDGGVRDRDVHMVADLARSDGMAAQFGVALRNPATERYRERGVWSWYATKSGGVLLCLDQDGTPPWTTFVPADPARVGRYLQDALDARKHARHTTPREARRVVRG